MCVFFTFFAGVVFLLRSSRQQLHASVDRKKMYLAHISRTLLLAY
jgi:hypothetical protein